MRLIITSYRFGKHEAEVLKFLNKIKKVAVITNAKDYKDPNIRQEKVEENFEYFRSIGLEPTEIDLRPYFNKPGAEELFKGYNLIWLAGGNVFLLRRALAYSKVDRFLYDAVRKNEIILGGESAGAIIMGPTLRHSEMVTEENDKEDNPHYIAEGYQASVIWGGLDFVNFVPVPHYKSGEYATGIEEYINRLDAARLTHKEMTDDQVIIINGFNEEFLK
jgi:dipeptidase E